jgi:CHAT domain-containing protein
VFEEGRPLDAALRLGSEALRASELFAARLPGASVFLSACSLGGQQGLTRKPTASDEWIGLYLPLFYAGARHLLVSLYEADSQTALMLMMELHAALSEGVSMAEAYRRAIRAVVAAGMPAALWANWYLTGLPV